MHLPLSEGGCKVPRWGLLAFNSQGRQITLVCIKPHPLMWCFVVWRCCYLSVLFSFGCLLLFCKLCLRAWVPGIPCRPGFCLWLCGLIRRLHLAIYIDIMLVFSSLQIREVLACNTNATWKLFISPTQHTKNLARYKPIKNKNKPTYPQTLYIGIEMIPR